MHITKVEIRTVAPPVDRFTWSDDLPDQYSTNTIVRIYTDEGVEGVAGVWNATSYDFERYTAESIRHLAPILLGKDPLLREHIWHEIRPRVFPLPPQSLAAIDIALWDLAGKVAGLPLYRLLGGARDKIPAYASTPLFEDVESYLKNAEEFIAQGFKAIKFHTWCIPELDLELARAVRKQYPSNDVAFMLDAENNYDRDGALRVAQELEAMGFTWFEAPLHDSDLDGYRELTSRVTIPILPSGNWFQDLHTFAEALHSKAWGRARTDAAMMGGITQTNKSNRPYRSGRHEMRDHVVGIQPSVGSQPAPDAGSRQLLLFRAVGSLRTLRIRDAGRHPRPTRRLCLCAGWAGPRPRRGLGGHGGGYHPFDCRRVGRCWIYRRRLIHMETLFC